MCSSFRNVGTEIPITEVTQAEAELPPVMTPGLESESEPQGTDSFIRLLIQQSFI